ncbi:MAG: YciI family protein [Bacteroidota bacterium]
MKDFMMLFHSEPNPDLNPTPEEIQEEVKLWHDWIGGISAQGKLKSQGEALGFEGKTMHADGSITDGPYAEVKEIIGGFIIVSAESIEEATELSKGCPALSIGGKVEVRDVMVFDDM